MKLTFVLSLIITAFLYVGIANSQIIPYTQKVSVSKNDKEILDRHISKYTAFTLDKKELITDLYRNGKIQFLLKIDEELEWSLKLELNDMRAYGYKQVYFTDDGEFEFNEPFVVNTFKGETFNGQVARFTIDDNNFFGVIFGDNYHYVIRPANDYTKNQTDKSFIAYRSSDIIPDDSISDYINDALEVSEGLEFKKDNSNKTKDGLMSSSSCKYYLKIATDADYQYYQAKSSNVSTVNNSIISILNIVEGVYESTFNIKFLVTAQYVCNTNTIYTSTDGKVLLEQFQDYWNYYRTSVDRNIAHLFTGKTLIAGKGWAYVGVIDNTSFRNSSVNSKRL